MSDKTIEDLNKSRRAVMDRGSDRERRNHYEVEASEFLENSKRIDLIHNTLVTEHYVPMKESIFAGYFLPRILGEIVDEAGDIEAMEDPYGLASSSRRGISWSDRWITAVGSPSSRVKVFEDDTDEYLFDVPPLLLTQAALSQGQRAPMNEILMEYFMRKNNSPAGAANFIFDHIEDTRIDILDRALEEEDTMITAWEYIIKRYRTEGRSVSPTGEVIRGDAEGFDPGTSVGDMFIYD